MGKTLENEMDHNGQIVGNGSIKKSSSKSSMLSEEEKDLRYGCFGARPNWMQGMNNIAGFVCGLSFANCFQSLANGLFGVVLSTVEKQFDLTSSESSWIASAYEIGPIPILLLLSFLGDRVHRPRSVALGLLSVTLGCIICFIPQFTTPPYMPSEEMRVDSMCLANKTSVCAVQDDTDYSYYLPVFIISRLLIGMGSTPILSVGVNYMDDCSTKEKFATYAGIFNAMSVVGPALGFVFGAWTLTIFTDFYLFTAEEIGIDSSDPRWVGAWWLAYTFTAGLCLINAVPMIGYPRDLPGAADIRAAKITEAHKDHIDSDPAIAPTSLAYAKSCAELKTLIKGVFSNPTWVCITLFAACDNFLIAGFTAFGPKYFEFGMSMSPAMAGVMFGVCLLPAGAGGTIIGGVIIEKFRMSCRTILRIIAVLCGVVTAGCALFLLICPSVTFPGVNSSYNTSVEDTGSYNLTATCNANCSCQEVLYEPICSYDKVQYFSPCHAGCTTLVEVDSATKEYYNCSCLGIPTEDPYSAQAKAGVCASGICTEAIIFLVGFFVAVLFIFICFTMYLAATLRCVKNEQTTFALNVQILFIKCLGTIPGPLFMGVAFDNVCILWQSECGSQGSCTYYDNAGLSRNFAWLVFGVKIISFVAIILANIFYRPPKMPDDIVVEVSAVEDGITMAALPGVYDRPEVSSNEGGVKNKKENDNDKNNDSTSTTSSRSGRKNYAFVEKIDDTEETDHF